MFIIFFDKKIDNSLEYTKVSNIDEINVNNIKYEINKKIDNIFINNSNITFIIGGSNGIHDSIKNIVNYKLSFSKMTFPHQLFRLILLEQIYRSFKILNNETYHK